MRTRILSHNRPRRRRQSVREEGCSGCNFRFGRASRRRRFGVSSTRLRKHLEQKTRKLCRRTQRLAVVRDFPQQDFALVDLLLPRPVYSDERRAVSPFQGQNTQGGMYRTRSFPDLRELGVVRRPTGPLLDNMALLVVAPQTHEQQTNASNGVLLPRFQTNCDCLLHSLHRQPEYAMQGAACTADSTPHVPAFRSRNTKPTVEQQKHTRKPSRPQPEQERKVWMSQLSFQIVVQVLLGRRQRQRRVTTRTNRG